MIRFVWILIAIGVFLALRYHLLNEKVRSAKKIRRGLQKRYLESIESEELKLIQTSGTEFANSQLVLPEDLDMLYLDALRLVRDNPKAKLYAMQIGRVKYGCHNADGKSTLVDEQAIQNDIEAARTS